MARTPTKMVEHFPLNPDANPALLKTMDSLTVLTDTLDSINRAVYFAKIRVPSRPRLKDLLMTPMELITPLMETATAFMEGLPALKDLLMAPTDLVTLLMEVVTALLEVIEEEPPAVLAALEGQATALASLPTLAEARSDRSTTIDCSTIRSHSPRNTPILEATAAIAGASRPEGTLCPSARQCSAFWSGSKSATSRRPLRA